MRFLMKCTAILLTMSMLLATGCLNKPKEEEYPPEWTEEEKSIEQQNILLPDPTLETKEPTPDEVGVEAIMRFGGIGAVYARVDRGEQLKITGLDNGFFTAEVNGIAVLADSRLVRMSSEIAPQEVNLFTQSGVTVYAGPYPYSKPLFNIRTNQRVKVLDQQGELALVEKDGFSGYVYRKDLGPAFSGGGVSNGIDGGEISLGRVAVYYALLPLLLPERELNVPGIGTVFADETELYLKILEKGETIRILDEQDGEYAILINGVRATVPCFAVEFPGAEDSEPWIGFTAKDTAVFSEYAGLAPDLSLGLNSEVHVVAKTESIVAVQQGDVIVYLPAASVSEEKQTSGSSATAGVSRGSTTVDTWTPPAL